MADEQDGLPPQKTSTQGPANEWEIVEPLTKRRSSSIRHGDRQAVMLHLLTLADKQIRLKMFEDARCVLEEALKLSTRVQDTNSQANILKRLGGVSFKEEHLWSSSEFCESAASLFHQLGRFVEEDACLRIASDCYTKLNLSTDAADAYQRQIDLTTDPARVEELRVRLACARAQENVSVTPQYNPDECPEGSPTILLLGAETALPDSSGCLEPAYVATQVASIDRMALLAASLFRTQPAKSVEIFDVCERRAARLGDTARRVCALNNLAAAQARAMGALPTAGGTGTVDSTPSVNTYRSALALAQAAGTVERELVILRNATPRLLKAGRIQEGLAACDRAEAISSQLVGEPDAQPVLEWIRPLRAQLQVLQQPDISATNTEPGSSPCVEAPPSPPTTTAAAEVGDKRPHLMELGFADIPFDKVRERVLQGQHTPASLSALLSSHATAADAMGRALHRSTKNGLFASAPTFSEGGSVQMALRCLQTYSQSLARCYVSHAQTVQHRVADSVSKAGMLQSRESETYLREAARVTHDKRMCAERLSAATQRLSHAQQQEEKCRTRHTAAMSPESRATNRETLRLQSKLSTAESVLTDAVHAISRARMDQAQIEDSTARTLRSVSKALQSTEQARISSLAASLRAFVTTEREFIRQRSKALDVLSAAVVAVDASTDVSLCVHDDTVRRMLSGEVLSYGDFQLVPPEELLRQLQEEEGTNEAAASSDAPATASRMGADYSSSSRATSISSDTESAGVRTSSTAADRSISNASSGDLGGFGQWVASVVDGTAGAASPPDSGSPAAVAACIAGGETSPSFASEVKVGASGTNSRDSTGSAASSSAGGSGGVWEGRSVRGGSVDEDGGEVLLPLMDSYLSLLFPSTRRQIRLAAGLEVGPEESETGASEEKCDVGVSEQEGQTAAETEAQSDDGLDEDSVAEAISSLRDGVRSRVLAAFASAEGRAAFVRALNLQRSRRQDVRGAAEFQELCNTVTTFLDAAVTEGDVRSVKMMMILAETFFLDCDPCDSSSHARREFVQQRVRSHEVWSSHHYWREALFMSVREEVQKHIYQQYHEDVTTYHELLLSQKRKRVEHRESLLREREAALARKAAAEAAEEEERAAAAEAAAEAEAQAAEEAAKLPPAMPIYVPSQRQRGGFRTFLKGFSDAVNSVVVPPASIDHVAAANAAGIGISGSRDRAGSASSTDGSSAASSIYVPPEMSEEEMTALLVKEFPDPVPPGVNIDPASFRHTYHNIVFGQLGSYTLAMMTFGATRRHTTRFLNRLCGILRLSPEAKEALLASAIGFADSLAKEREAEQQTAPDAVTASRLDQTAEHDNTAPPATSYEPVG